MVKLYNIYENIILEEIANQQVWLTNLGSITESIKDYFNINDGVYYLCDISYPDKETDVNVMRWCLITHYGASKKDGGAIIRVYEINRGGDASVIGSKTFRLDKISKIRFSKVKMFQLSQLKGSVKLTKNKSKGSFNGSLSFNPNSDNIKNIFSKIYSVIKIGTYKYADSTLKQKEKQELKKQTEPEKQVEPQKQEPIKNEPIEKQNNMNNEPQINNDEENNNELNKV
jgi:hypothetical protein